MYLLNYKSDITYNLSIRETKTIFLQFLFKKRAEYELLAMLQITEVLPVPDLYKEALIPRLAHLCYFCLTTPRTVAEKASLIRKAIYFV